MKLSLFQKVRLSLIIPALLTVFAAAVALYSFLVYMPRAYESLERDKANEMTRKLVFLQRHFERELKEGDIEDIRHEVSSLGAYASHGYAFLANEKDIVIAATRLDWIGKNLREVSPRKFKPDIEKVRTSYAGQIVFTEDRLSALGCYPVNMGGAGSERPASVGVLFLQHDLSAPRALLRRNLEGQLLDVFAFFALTAFVIWLFLYFSLSKPMSYLLRTAEKLASGDLKARTGLSGDNEIGAICRAFDVMAAEIEDMHRSLAETGDRLKNAQKVAGLGTFEADLKKGAVIFSDELSYLLCGKRAECLFSVDSFMEFFQDSEKERLEGFFSGNYTGEEYSADCRIRRADGVYGTVRLNVRSSGPDLVIGTMHDISARKLAEEEIREGNENFRSMFEQNQDAQLIIRHGTCDVMDANPAAVTLFSFPREAIIEKGAALFLTPEELERFRDIILSAKRGEVIKIDRMEIRRENGSVITASLRGQLVNVRQSSVICCTIRDFTERIRMEEEAKLMQAKLIQANKMTSVGTLASGIAHEINNPNNFIVFNAGVLTDAWKDAALVLEERYNRNGNFSLGGVPYAEMRNVVPELLSGITEGSRRIKSIVDNLKDFSRVDRQGLGGVIDVNSAVHASCSLLKNQIGKYTENFVIECREGLPLINGSAQRIEQVVINLVLNALHALSDRSRRIHVSTGLSEDGRLVLIRVKDDGIGMPKEVLERVTEPFFTTKITTGGTGLGLSISYTIVKEHNGALDFVSEPGKGTTATLCLPVSAQGLPS